MLLALQLRHGEQPAHGLVQRLREAPMKITRYKPSRIEPRIGFLHGDKGGAPVLIERSSWRTVSGFYFRTDRTGMICIEFRNYSKAW